ncbi:MAG: hypothetical protein LBT46_09190 [Planctomycetaceae bacterium]|nr:hypothetical protein [Planctomycetaceae bacterium]
MLGSGWSPSDVGEALLLDEQTIRSYFLRYKESGEYGFVPMNYSGKEPFLNEKQQAELAAASRREHLSFEPEDLSLCYGNLQREVFCNRYEVPASPA